MATDPNLGFTLPYDGQPNAVTVIAAGLQAVSAAAVGGGDAGGYFITGLNLEYFSATQFKVKTGAAWVSGAGLVNITADLTVTPTLGASAFHHVYLYSNNGTGAVEVSTTGPVLYFGTAHQKTGDATRRYLGSILTNASSQILNFFMRGDFVLYKINTYAAPSRVLSNGVSITEVNVPLAAMVPPTCRLALANLTNLATNASVNVGSSDDSVTLASGALFGVPPGGVVQPWLGLDASRQVSYLYQATPTGGGFYIDVLGYRFDR